MVDFLNPVVIEDEFISQTNLSFVVDGIFIWEYFITLNYELSFVRRHRQYRWTIWIYSLTRLCTLIFVIINLIVNSTSNPINCQLLIISELIFAYLGLTGASLLIVLRVIAIWNKNRIAVAIAICAWTTSIAFQIHNVTRPLNSVWVPAQRTCGVQNTERSKGNMIATLVSDVVLLLTMLVGLVRLRKDGTLFGFGKLLWRQGLAWLFLATIAEVPPVVFLSLNLNDALNLMFQTPAPIVMTIAATRMYRSLCEFSDHGWTQRGRAASTETKPSFAAPIPLNRVEVTLHRSSEVYPPSNVGRDVSYGAYSAGNQSQDKPLVLSISDDLDNGVKRG